VGIILGEDHPTRGGQRAEIVGRERRKLEPVQDSESNRDLELTEPLSTSIAKDTGLVPNKTTGTDTRWWDGHMQAFKSISSITPRLVQPAVTENAGRLTAAIEGVANFLKSASDDVSRKGGERTSSRPHQTSRRSRRSLRGVVGVGIAVVVVTGTQTDLEAPSHLRRRRRQRHWQDIHANKQHRRVRSRP
jgi:hypothetical protein